jgi:hypothetical protein
VEPEARRGGARARYIMSTGPRRLARRFLSVVAAIAVTLDTSTLVARWTGPLG